MVSPELDLSEEIGEKHQTVLRTINGVGISIEQMVEAAKSEYRTYQGVISGMLATLTIVEKVKNLVQKEIDEERLDGDLVKQILPWVQRVGDEITESIAMNRKELSVKQGIVEGLTKATKHCEVLFKNEEVKVKSRLNDAERGKRDNGGRPLPIREIMEAREEAPPSSGAEPAPSSAVTSSEPPPVIPSVKPSKRTYRRRK